MMKALKNFWDNEDGAAMLEYGLIAALVSVVAIASLQEIGTKLNAAFVAIKDKLPGSAA
jgi:pilus assembly protein Flp/PilA